MDGERIAIRVDAVALAELGWSLSEAEIIERFGPRTLVFSDMRSLPGLLAVPA